MIAPSVHALFYKVIMKVIESVCAPLMTERQSVVVDNRVDNAKRRWLERTLGPIVTSLNAHCVLKSL